MAAEYLQIALNLPVSRTFTYIGQDDVSYEVGMRVSVPFGSREVQGYVVDVSSAAPAVDYALKSILKVLDPVPIFDSSFWSTARWMSDMYMCGTGEALFAMLPGKGKREKKPDDCTYEKSSVELTQEQQEAVNTVLAGNGSVFYLHGVTGSGKTEVFLSLAEKMIEQGRGIIYLVPEIALTHQMIETVRVRFGNKVAVLHSGLTQSNRTAQWRRIQRGEAVFVVGARSAVFAPVRSLGLIIIDEEHESSYKSDSSPRYHARQVAMYRAKRENAALVMGSATPSVEAYYLMEKGMIRRLSLSRRVAGGTFPQIRIVNMLNQKSSISDTLRDEIINAYSCGKQAILFLNRRGFFFNFSCGDCGFEMKCTHCSIPLTYHKSEGRLVCHYCGYSARPVKICPQCGSLNVGYTGFGTEKIEDDVRRLFPYMKVLRLDSDTAGRRDEILDQFLHHKADILLGTQMVAKGFNFPDVSLVGIVLADTTLQMPDFRAAERTFSLLTQVSGRAGRFAPDGKVVIQTYRPGNCAVVCAANRDDKGFYAMELETRRQLGFPPFSRLFRFVFRGKSKEKSESAASAFAGSLNAVPDAPFRIMGPAECPLAVVSDNHRFQLIIVTDNFALTHGILSAVLSKFRVPSGIYIEIDVDPSNLM
ncbi:MAG: primosomal protein N' [Spirochaetia bacterium]|nr:primosomal protein N' [Spirochaetia bacterium]